MLYRSRGSLLLDSSLALLIPTAVLGANSDLAEIARAYESQIQRVRQQVPPTFRLTERLFELKPSADSRIFKAQIVRDLESSLFAIEKKVRSARRRNNLSSITLQLGGGRQGTILSSRPRPRIGFFPISANPITNGHIVAALKAVAQGDLDHIVLMPNTDRSKPILANNEALRHTLAKRAQSEIPCLSYSPIALGTSLDGETHFWRWLELNGGAEFEPVYIAGGDHNAYVKKDGKPDTLGKISWARDRGLLPEDVSAMLVKRNGYSTTPVKPPAGVKPVPVTYLAPTLFDSSSSTLRTALDGIPNFAQRELLLMPWRSARSLARLAGGSALALPKPVGSVKSRRRLYKPTGTLLPFVTQTRRFKR